MRTFNNQVQTGIVLNAARVGTAIPLKNIYIFSIAAIIAGTPTGTIKLQVSNDPETNDSMPSANPQPTPTNWLDLANSSVSVTASGETMWSVKDVSYNWVRTSYADGSSGASTATLTTIVNAKGV